MKQPGSIFRSADTRCCLLLVVVALVAYWPLTFHVFSLKNDALSYFLPLRYHVSTAIREGYFPYWSPYIYTGLPLHADIQSGVWNPVVMLLSLFTVYDMSVLQDETLLYIALGGIGFFKLCRTFDLGHRIAFALAVAYLCSGFVIDSGAFIPWIASAAYLPFVLCFFFRLLRRPSYAAAVQLGVSHALLFLAGYLSFFIVTSYLLLFTGLGSLLYHWRRNDRTNTLQLLKCWLTAAAVAALVCSPALISYIEFLPYYSRGGGASPDAAQLNPFRLANTISYLLPQASYLLDGGNDISSRNAFIGTVPLVFLVYAFRYRFTAVQKTIAVITAVCFLFSLGKATPVRAFFYETLPLMDSFRHPATVRLFTTAGLLLLAGFGWQRFAQDGSKAVVRKIILAVMAAVVALMIYGMLKTEGSPFPRWNGFSAAGIKEWLDGASFASWVVLTGFLQLPFLAVLLARPAGKTAAIAATFNMLVMTFAALPFTTVSQHRVGEVNAFVHSKPTGFPAHEAWLPVQDSINDPSLLTPSGYTVFYDKRIAIQDHIITPTVNSAYGDLLRDTALRREVSSHPFAYLAKGGRTDLTRFTPNAFSFTATATAPDTLHITQQYNPHWQAFINGRPAAVARGHKALMQLALPAGRNEVELVYRSPLVAAAAIVAVTVLAACLILVFYRKWK